MKIVIIGYSGSGKSTLASKLAKLYNLPLLYLDKISFNPNWKEKTREEKVEALREFLNKNQDGWIIDGNFFSILMEERLAQADLIIHLDFNRFTCYFSSLKRAISYRNKYRESAPIHCNEKFDISFQWWILVQGRSKHRKDRIKKIASYYENKFLNFKNRKEVNAYLEMVKKYKNK